MRAHDWSASPARPGAGLAAEPQDGRAHHSRLPLPNVHLVGRGTDQPLQRRLPAHARAAAPRRSGQVRRRIWSEIWDIIGPQTTPSSRRAGPPGTRAAARPGTEWLPGRNLLHLLLQPDARRMVGVGGIFSALTEDTQTDSRPAAAAHLAGVIRPDHGGKDGRSKRAKPPSRCLRRQPLRLPLRPFIFSTVRKALGWPAPRSRKHRLPPPASIDLQRPRRSEIALAVGSGVADGPGRGRGRPGVRMRDLPGGAWPEPPQTAIVLPVMQSGQVDLAGFLLAGVSPSPDSTTTTEVLWTCWPGTSPPPSPTPRAYEEEKRRAEALAELDRAKTAFFSNVSHEFRTPLTLMLGPVEDLLAEQRRQTVSRRQDQLEVVNRNGLRLLRLVNTLLDFSRIEAGRVRAVYRADRSRRLSPPTSPAFSARRASGPGCDWWSIARRWREPVFVDREMWEKIVLNLLSNAFKFTFEGEIAVTLRQAGQIAELLVRDTGTGIPAEEMPRLFERSTGSRTHGAAPTKAAASAWRWCRNWSSCTAARSPPRARFGRGTTFIVSIPLGSAHLPPNRSGRPHRPRRYGCKPLTSRRRCGGSPTAFEPG